MVTSARLTRVLRNSRLAYDRHFDLSGIAKFLLDRQRDGSGEVLGFEVRYMFRMHKDADLKN
jgi:hypothetical protein